MAEQFTEREFDAMDRIIEVLRSTEWNDNTEHIPSAGRVPSFIARKSRIETYKVYRLLNYLVAHQYLHTTGNGSRTRYHAGRA